MLSSNHAISCCICGHQTVGGKENCSVWLIGRQKYIEKNLPRIIHEGQECCLQQLGNDQGPLYLQNWNAENQLKFEIFLWLAPQRDKNTVETLLSPLQRHVVLFHWLSIDGDTRKTHFQFPLARFPLNIQCPYPNIENSPGISSIHPNQRILWIHLQTDFFESTNRKRLNRPPFQISNTHKPLWFDINLNEKSIDICIQAPNYYQPTAIIIDCAKKSLNYLWEVVAQQHSDCSVSRLYYFHPWFCPNCFAWLTLL